MKYSGVHLILNFPRRPRTTMGSPFVHRGRNTSSVSSSSVKRRGEKHGIASAARRSSIGEVDGGLVGAAASAIASVEAGGISMPFVCESGG